MALPPSTIPGGKPNDAAAAMEAIARAKGGKISKLVKGLAGYVAVDQAFEHAPNIYQAAVEYFGKSGVDVHQLAVDSSSTVRATVVDYLLKKGLDVSLIEGANLSASEFNAYKDVLIKHKNAADAAYVAEQAKVPSTTNPEIDRIAKNLDIERICRGLGISSDLYATILRGINTHTPDDIEAFQLHRRLYGQQAI